MTKVHDITELPKKAFFQNRKAAIGAAVGIIAAGIAIALTSKLENDSEEIVIEEPATD